MYGDAWAFGTCTPKEPIVARTLGLAAFLSSARIAVLLHRSAVRWVRHSLERFIGIEEYGGRAFIDQLHGHHRLKNSRCYGDAQRAQCRVEFLVQREGFLGPRRSQEARPSLTACVTIQSKLRNY